MEMESRMNRNSFAFAKRKRKRVLAIVLAMLMFVTGIDFSGMQYVSAADESKVDIITAFTAIPEGTANQQLAVGASASEIKLPNSLSVTSEVYNIDETQAVTGAAITVTGAAISVNPTYNLTGITWKIDAGQSSSDTFTSSAGNTYTYVPVLPLADSEGNSIQLADGVSLPQIRVQIEDSDKWAFSQRTTIDGVEITVKAEKDVFPEGAVLHAEKVTSADDKEKIQSAVTKEVKAEDTAKTVAELVSFDITITDADGNELQPDTSKGKVKVSFAQLPMVTKNTAPTQELKVFHMDDSLNEAKGLDTTVDQEAGTLEAPAEHFTVYTAALLTATAADGEASVTASDNTVTYYDTLDAAITAAQGMSGSTLTLLKGVTSGSNVQITSGTFTIDLNGQTLSFNDNSVIISGTANVTFKDGASGGKITRCTGAFPAIYVYSGAMLKIEGGTYESVSGSASIRNYGGTIGDLLADGYAYKNISDGTWVTDVSGNEISNVTVQEAPTEIFCASVTEADNTVHNYLILDKAITAAQGMSGSTLTLLKDVTRNLDVYIASGTFTIDLNGQTLSFTGNRQIFICGNANITFKGSGSGGKITGAGTNSTVYVYSENNLKIEGGTYESGSGVASITTVSGTVGNLLADGYAYKNISDGTWVSDMSGTEISNVTVQEAPTEMFCASVTEADNTIHYYVTLDKAVAAAKSMSGSMLTLLKGVTQGSTVQITSGTFTIDLNGQTLSFTSNCHVEISGNANITFKDSGSGGTITGAGAYSTVYVYSGAMLKIEGGTYESGSAASIFIEGTIGALLADGYAYRNISGGTWVTDMSGHSISNVTVQAIPVTITAQPEDAFVLSSYTDAAAPTFSVTADNTAASSGKTITYQWYKDSTLVSNGTGANYKVPTGLAAGTYTYYCAVTCNGYTVNTKSVKLTVYNEGSGNFSVTTASNNTIYFSTLEEAIAAAKGMSGSTVKLLADATTANEVDVSSGTFTIDLNGHTWTSTTSAFALQLKRGKLALMVTLKDSGSGGKITSSTAFEIIRSNDASVIIQSGIYDNESGSGNAVLSAFGSGMITIQGGAFQTSKDLNYLVSLQGVNASISGGTFSGASVLFWQYGSIALTGGTYTKIKNSSGNIGELLASGYGYKQSGTWVNDTSGTDICNITVQPTPAKITAQPQNATNATYGYTSAPTMSVTAEKTAAAPEGSNISYQWYRVKSDSETSDTKVDGASLGTLTIPTGLDAGTYSFYCVVSCDGYIVNSQSATFTVNPKDLSGADVTLTIPEGGYTYDATAKTPGVTVVLDGKTLTLTDDYTVVYSENTNAGTAKATISGTNNYSGSANKTFAIAKAAQSAFSITEVTGKKYGDAAFALGTTGGSGTGTVTYSVPENNGVLSVSGNEATIIGADTVTVTAVNAGDDNYYSATATRQITIGKAYTSIAFNPSYMGNTYYTGSPLSVPTAADLNISGASYTNVTFTWYQNSVTEGNRMSTAPSAPGTYVVVASITETANASAASAEKNVTIGFYSGAVAVLYNGSTAKADWYSADVAITADGYTVSDSADGTFAESYLLSGEGAVSKTLYFKQNSTGYITDGKSVSVSIDKTAPAFSGETDGITISDNNWKGFLNKITFGHFFKETQEVYISATDNGSGVDKYYCYFDTNGSTNVKTAEELDKLSFSQVGNTHFSIGEDKYVIYAYAVDKAGNKSAYICTDGIVIDKTAPTVTLTAPASSNIGDVSATAKVKMNETGTIAYVVKTSEQSGIAAGDILDDTEKKTVSVADGQADTNLDVTFSGLTANTTYYVYAVGTDRVGHNSEVKSASFTTTKTQPTFTANPTITGTYGQQVKDMTVSQVASTNVVAGSWSVSGTDKPSVGTSATYDVVFTPDNAVQYATVTVPVIPTVNPKSLTATGVTIGEVSGTYTYDGMAKEPTVTVADSAATITASDYEYSYSNNISAGTATVTVAGKGNYTGTVNRTFTIAKAAAPSITYPAASIITYGQKLSASTLTGGSTQYGTFAWTDGNTVPTVANSGYEVTFTPSGNTDANYEAVDTTDTVAVTVTKATPSVAVNVALSGNAGSRKATLTATITGAGDGEAPTGTVKFVNTTSGSDADIAGATAVTITGGKATYTWTGLADQIYKVKAVYSGSDNYKTANSTELEVDTAKQNQAVLTIDSIGTKTYGDSSFTLSATGGSGNGDVTFASSEPSIVSISGATATIHKAGTVTITATKAEDSTYNEMSGSVLLTIGKKVLSLGTGNVLTLSQDSYTYDGTAKEPGVTVKLDGKTLTGNSDYTVAYANNVNVGTAQVTVTGQGNYTGTIDTNFTIAKANQNTLDITEVTGKKYMDSAFTLTATGGSGTGGVTYFVPENNGVLSISGSTATIIGAGTVTVTAIKSGDSNYNNNTVTREITVAKAAAPSITYPAASGITYGQKLSASALNGGSTQYGAFAWTDDSMVPTVTNSGYEVTFTPNTATLKNYEAITGTTDTAAITVSKVTPAVSVNAIVSGKSGDRKATLTATVTGVGYGETPTGTVKFINSTGGSDAVITGATAVTMTDGKATFEWTGLANQIYKVKAVYSGDGNYSTATSTELEVDTNKKEQAALVIGNIGTKTYGDGTFTLLATGGSGTGDVTFTSSDPTIVSVSGTTATIHKAGTVNLTATKAATDTYNEATVSVALTVGKKTLIVKADNKQNIIKGAAMPALTYTVTGLVGSDTFTGPTLSTTATDTNTVGEYDITISGGTLVNADNYTINYTGSKLTIINEPASPGGSSGGSGSPTGGSSTNTTTDQAQPDTGTPVIKDAGNKEGWEAIKEQISQTREGDTVTIEMNGSLVVPGKVLDAIRGTDTTLVFDMSDDITWSINGQSITASSLNNVNLDVTLDTDAIPAGIISQIAGEQDFDTLSLAYDGPFGFTSVLTINLNKINAGKYGNLFYYNPETKQLTLQEVEKIGEKGNVELPFPHASDYVVIISEEPMLEKTLDQIANSAVKGTLYVGGTEKKNMTLKFKLPQLLKEAVEKDSSILKITYQSSNPKVATVTASGKIIAKKAGKTTVTTLVTINGVQRKFQTEITVSKAYIKLIGSTNTLKTGSTFTYKAIGYGVKTEDILYYTSKKSIVEINKITGKAKARTKGTDYIIAKAGKVKVKIKVKVS